MNRGRCHVCGSRLSSGHHNETVCHTCNDRERSHERYLKQLSELIDRLSKISIEQLSNKPLEKLLDYGEMLEKIQLSEG